MVRAQEEEQNKPTIPVGFFVFEKWKKNIRFIYYFLKNRHHIGCTSNLDLRMEFHRNSEARKFTAKANDWNLYLNFICDNKKQAFAIERHIKSMKSKIDIQNLKKFPEIIARLKESFC